VFVGGGSYYKDATCKATCAWPDVVICDPGTTVCPIVDSQGQGMVQTVCEPSAVLPPGFNVCGLP
jgi:hypothetical protein